MKQVEEEEETLNHAFSFHILYFEEKEIFFIIPFTQTTTTLVSKKYGDRQMVYDRDWSTRSEKS